MPFLPTAVFLPTTVFPAPLPKSLLQFVPQNPIEMGDKDKLQDMLSFNFPEFDFKDILTPELDRGTLDKIYEYLDSDLREQEALLLRLAEFERKLDSWML